MNSENVKPVEGTAEEIDWKEVAHRAQGHISCLLLYATPHSNDSHAIDANTFLTEVRKVLGLGPHRTQDQFAPGFSRPLPTRARQPNEREQVMLAALEFAEKTLEYYGAQDTLRIVRHAITPPQVRG